MHRHPTTDLLRDEDHIAILDPEEWKVIPQGARNNRSSFGFFNIKTLKVLLIDEAISALAPPPHGTLPKLSVESYVPTFTQNLSATDIPEKFDMFKNPVGLGGYQFPCLSEATCSALFDEALKIHSECGLPLNHMGLHIKYSLPQLWKWVKILVSRVSPSITTLHPDSSLKLQSAFFVRYEDGESHSSHIDKTDLTINLCLGKSFTGGELLLSPDLPNSVPIPHRVGHAIVHHGKQLHQAHPTKGDRMNLIIWCRVLASLPFWTKLPSDIQDSVLFHVDGITIAAFLCCSKKSHKAVTDATWCSRIAIEFPSLKDEADLVHKEQRLSYQTLYKFAWTESVVDTMAKPLREGTQVYGMKETMDGARRRKIEETNAAKKKSRKILNTCPPGTTRNLQQRLSQVLSTDGSFPWFLPLPHYKTHIRNFETPVEPSPIDPYNLGAFQEIKQSPPPFFTDLYPSPDPNPTQFNPLLFAILEHPYGPPIELDTDGSRLDQYPWFWPFGGESWSSTRNETRFCIAPYNDLLYFVIYEDRSRNSG